MTLTVIICTRNREKDLLECLDCLKKQMALPDECVIVEDTTEKKNFSLVRMKEFFRTTKIKCQYLQLKSASIAKSRNIGLFKAKGEIVLFLDDDVIFTPDLIKNYLALHQKYPEVLGFVGKILPVQVNTFTRFASWYGCRSLLFSKKMTQVPFYPTLTLSLRKDKVKRRNVEFDPTLAKTCEDVDFLLKLTTKGERMMFSPKIISWHKFRGNLFTFCKRYMEYSSNFALLAERYPKYFSIERYFPNRKLEWIAFPFFLFFSSRALTLEATIYEKLPSDLFWPSFLAHLSHFLGIYFSKKGQQSLVINFQEIWFNPHK